MKGWNRKQHPSFNANQIFHHINIPKHDSALRENGGHKKKKKKDNTDESRVGNIETKKKEERGN